MRIYTKTGDAGETGLIGGVRVSKTSLRIAAIGDVDELNCAIGLAAVGGSPLAAELKSIQSTLFDLGAELASDPDGGVRYEAIGEGDVGRLEGGIDRMSAELEPLRAFILPGGTEEASRLHLARAVCRRAERTVLLLDAESPVRDEAKRFLNRLSDWLFTAARSANAANGVADVKWMKMEDR